MSYPFRNSSGECSHWNTYQEHSKNLNFALGLAQPVVDHYAPMTITQKIGWGSNIYIVVEREVLCCKDFFDASKGHGRPLGSAEQHAL